MKRWLSIIVALLCLLLLPGCSKDKQFDISGAAGIELQSGNTGTKVTVTAAEGIAHITDNINSIRFTRGGSSRNYSGYSYSIVWYDENGDRITAIIVGGSGTVDYNGHFYYAVSGGGVDVEFLDRLLYPEQAARTDGGALAAEEAGAETVTAEYSYNYVSIALELPEGWEYSVTEYSPDAYGFGISFWPEGYDEGKVNLFYYPSFGVCGTGLEEKEFTFVSGLHGYMGTYDNNQVWDFISFRGLAGDYAATTTNVGAWWPEHGDTAMEILNRAKLGADLIDEAAAIELAKTACTVEYEHTAASFDAVAGRWRVRFYSLKSDNDMQTVYLDTQGNVVGVENE